MWHRRRIDALWFLALAVASCFFLWSCSGSAQGPVPTTVAADTMAQVREGEPIAVGYIVWPPAVIKDPNTGQLSGHHVDAMNVIAREADIKLDWKETDWNTFVAELQNHTIDVMISGAYITIPRAKVVSFTRPLFYLGNAAIVRPQETRFSKPEDLNAPGVTVAVTQGTGEHQWAQEYLSKATIRAIGGSDLSLPLQEVVAGLATAAVSDAYTVQRFAETHREVKALFLDKPFNLTAVAWPVRRDDEAWKDFLNLSIGYLESSRKLRRLEAKYNAPWTHVRVEYE